MNFLFLKKSLTNILFWLCLVLSLLLSTTPVQVKTENQNVFIELDLRTLELAKTTLEIQTGLMYRKNLCARCGIVFAFETEDYRSFWMKNTLLPLDIIFVNKNGKINTIHTNTTPLDQSLRYPSKAPSKYVLEFRSGFSEQYSLKEGSYLNLEKLLTTTIPFDHGYRLTNN